MKHSRPRHQAGYMMHLKTAIFDDFAVRSMLKGAPRGADGRFDDTWWLSMVPVHYQKPARVILERVHACTHIPASDLVAVERERFIEALIGEIRVAWDARELYVTAEMLEPVLARRR